MTPASGVPIIEHVIREDDILPTGTIDPNTGDYGDIPGIVDSDGMIPNARAVPPRKQALDGGDIRHFAHHVWQLMTIVEPNVTFAHAYPDYIADIGDTYTDRFADQSQRDVRVHTVPDTITWKVHRRAPGSLSNKPFGPDKQWKPRLIDRSIAHESDTTELVDIYEQDFDNVIQFDIFSQTNQKCEELAEWFEDQIVVFQWYFQQVGIPRVLFMERTTDERVDRLASGLNTRSLRYYVRTKRYYRFDNDRMGEIRMRLLAVVNTDAELARFETGTLQNDLL
jgi:hypothetical protein